MFFWLSFSFVIASIVFCFVFKMMGAFLAGMITFTILSFINSLLPNNWTDKKKRFVSLFGVVLILIGILSGMIGGSIAFVQHAMSVGDVMRDMASIIDDLKAILPLSISSHLPPDEATLRLAASDWLREHAQDLQVVGKDTAKAFVHIVMGMVVSGILYLSMPLKPQGILSESIRDRMINFSNVFNNVVSSQVTISAVNTVFTAIYLVVLLPLFGQHVSFAWTLVILTFFLGMIPIVGNLLSNTAIVLLSLKTGWEVGVASLVFLVVIHKLEYFMNARIVGNKIGSSPWELLIAMMAMEAMFGLTGMAIAPVVYAYIKEELKTKNLV